MESSKTFLLESLLNWTEKKVTRRPQQNAKTGTLLLVLQGACLHYSILCSIFISHPSNDNVPFCPLHIISTFDWFAPKTLQGPLCDNVDYITPLLV